METDRADPVCGSTVPQSHQTTATTTVYENQGGGSFIPLSEDLVDVQEGAARFGDADGDSDPDLVVTGQDNDLNRIAKLYENDGTGSFTAAGAELEGVGRTSVEWADLGDDGDQDLIITGGPRSATIYENDESGDFSPLNADLTGVARGSSAAGDADGDGDMDLIVTGNDNFSVASTRLYVNRRVQEGPNRSPRFAERFEAQPVAAGTEQSWIVEAGDPNGDPVSISAQGTNASVEDRGNGVAIVTFAPDRSQVGQTVSLTVEVTDSEGSSDSFSRQVEVPSLFAAFDAGLTGVQFSSSSIADVNGDGNKDLLITGVNENDALTAILYLGSGDGSFEEAATDLTGVQDGATSIADVDGDGNEDLLVTGRDENFAPTATLYLGAGNGNFQEAGAGLAGVINSSTSIEDLNGDGNKDLLITGWDGSNPTATLYLGGGDGTFEEAGADLTGVRFGATSITDIDEDGNKDLLITGWDGSNPTATVYLGGGDGTFVEADAGLTGVWFSATSIADIDNDENEDVLLVGRDENNSATATLYLGGGDGTFEEAETDLTGSTFSATSIADFDADGNEDILITGEEIRPTASTLYLGNGDGTFQEVDAGLIGVERGTSTSAADVNGDGNEDLFITGERERAGVREPSTLFYENLLGGEQQCPLAWSLGVSGTDASGDSIAVTLGQSGAATAGIDPACGEEELSPKPPSEVFDVRFTGTDLPGVGIGEGLARDIRPTDQPTPEAAESAPATWRMEVQSESYPVTFNWDSGALADSLPGKPVRLVDVVTGGDLVDVDMKSTGSYTLENSSVTALEIRLDRALTREVPIAAGWNLLSVPLQASDPSFGSVLPPCESGFFFEPGSGYNEISDGEAVPVGRGLFANCSAGTAEIAGQAPDSATVAVEAGWNVIGPLADSVDTASITSTPAGIVTTYFFRFSPGGGYTVASTLGPTR